MFNRGNQLWHTDASFIKARAAYSLLLVHEVPESGGETWFADTRSAYEDLPSDMEKRIDGLQAVHSVWWSRRIAGYDVSDEQIASAVDYLKTLSDRVGLTGYGMGRALALRAATMIRGLAGAVVW